MPSGSFSLHCMECTVGKPNEKKATKKDKAEKPSKGSVFKKLKNVITDWQGKDE
jgi:hypothetical protein